MFSERNSSRFYRQKRSYDRESHSGGEHDEKEEWSNRQNVASQPTSNDHHGKRRCKTEESRVHQSGEGIQKEVSVTK